MSLPRNVTRPLSGAQRPVTVLINVDLPEPFAPINKLILCGKRSMLAPSSACKPPNDFVILLMVNRDNSVISPRAIAL